MLHHCRSELYFLQALPTEQLQYLINTIKNRILNLHVCHNATRCFRLQSKIDWMIWFAWRHSGPGCPLLWWDRARSCQWSTLALCHLQRRTIACNQRRLVTPNLRAQVPDNTWLRRRWRIIGCLLWLWTAFPELAGLPRSREAPKRGRCNEFYLSDPNLCIVLLFPVWCQSVSPLKLPFDCRSPDGKINNQRYMLTIIDIVKDSLDF